MSLLDQVRNLPQQVIDRLKELEPLAREYDQLRKFAERLGVKYSPDSAQAEADAQRTPTTRAGATRARAKQPSGRAPANTARAARAPGSTHAARPPATPRGARSTSRQRAADSAPAAGASAASAPTRKRKTAGTSQRSGRRRASTVRPGQRHDDVLRLVGENPGITVREIGERLGVDSTGLYRVVKRLVDDGRVHKDGPRLHPVQSATASSPTPDAAADSAPEAAPGSQAEAPEANAPVEPESPAAAADTASRDEP